MRQDLHLAYYAEHLIAQLIELTQEWTEEWSPLLSFSTSAALTEYGLQMPRDPAPEVGQRFDATFSCTLREAHQINPSIHDGITALIRQTGKNEYHVAGWSYWFLPRADRIQHLSDNNRGTAHHTFAVLSSTGAFDLLCRLSRNSVEVFVDGALTVYRG